MTYEFAYNRLFDYSMYGFTPNSYYANNSYNNSGFNSFDDIFSFRYRNLIQNPQQRVSFDYSSPSIMAPNLSMSNLTTPSLMMPNLSMPSLMTPNLMMPTLQLPPLQLSFTPQAPALNFNLPNPFANSTPAQTTTPTQTSASAQTRTPAKHTVTNSSRYQYNSGVKPPSGKYDLAWWKSQGYDETMGKRLAQDAVRTAVKDPGECAGYTRRTINRLYGTNFARAGKAKDFGNTFLAGSQLKGKFKKITVPGLKDSDIPEGAIVIWYPGKPGYTKGKAAVCGHIAIAHNGAGYANGVVQNLSTYSEIWIPVKA